MSRYRDITAKVVHIDRAKQKQPDTYSFSESLPLAILIAFIAFCCAVLIGFGLGALWPR